MTIRVPSTLETLWRSSGSKVSSVPDPASTTSPPASIRAEPSTTISQPALAPGEELGEHQVRERAWLMVVDGSARIEAGGDVVEAGSGTLLTFEPDERHKVSSVDGTRIVMILSSWPADGHYPNWPGDVLPST